MSAPISELPQWRVVLAVWLLALGLYGLTGGGRFFLVDETAPYQVTRYWLTGEPVAASINTPRGPDGRYWAQLGPAISVLAIPFYGAGELLDRTLPDTWKAALAGEELGDPGAVLWGGDIHIFAVCFFNAFVTASLLVVYLCIQRLLGYRSADALLATGALGCTTLLFTYSKNFLTHSLVALLLLGSFGALVRARDRRAPYWLALAGLLSGVMIQTRPSSVLVVPVLALYAGLAIRSAPCSTSAMHRSSMPTPHR